MLYTTLFYIFFSSAILIYGIGLNTSTIICDSIHSLFLPLIKLCVTVVSSTVLSWLIIKHLLVPLKLVELYPLIAMFLFITLNIFVEAMIRICSGQETSDFNFSFLITLLALNESTSIIDVILISLSCIISFLIMLPILYSLKKRIAITSNDSFFKNKKCLLFIAIAILVIFLSVGNISWLNPGVMK